MVRTVADGKTTTVIHSVSERKVRNSLYFLRIIPAENPHSEEDIQCDDRIKNLIVQARNEPVAE